MNDNKDNGNKGSALEQKSDEKQVGRQTELKSSNVV